MKSEGVRPEELGGGPQKVLRFKCPACNAQVLATEREAYWGATCGACGVKFIPVDRKTRVREAKWSMTRTVIAIAVVVVMAPLILAGLATIGLAAAGFYWVAIPVAVVVWLVVRKRK